MKKSYNFKNFIKHSICIILLFVIGCSNPSEHSSIVSDTTFSKENNETASEENQIDKNVDLLGIYHGVQPSYYLKNQYGDDMEINGNKVPVPSIDFKFILKENGIVNLQQINLEDNSRVYYDGSFSVANNNGMINIVCNLSDGHSSNPTYKIVIDKSSNSITCIGNNEPEFSLERNTLSSSTKDDNPKTDIQTRADGTYSYNDESAKISITINGERWIGKTTIISGMGDSYDNPEYQSGIVKGNELYEESGMVKIGYVNGRNLITTIGGSTVTLSK